MNKFMNSANTFAFIVIAVICFFSVNIISGLSFNKFEADFTEDGLYSLSEGSYSIVENNDEPITLRFFYSNKLANGYPAIKAYASRITGLLEEYAKASNGLITLHKIDPEPFTDDEDLATSYGLKGAPIDNQGTKVYFGLVATNSTDQKQLIPIFHFEREKFIEYDISRIISDLGGKERPTIGVLSDLPIDTPTFFGVPGLGGGKSWVILEQMRQLFNVVPVKATDSTIADNVDVVMVAQPKELTDNVLYALDQFVLKGGRAIFFLDPAAEGKDGSVPTENSNFDGKVNTLLQSWGVRVDPFQVVADRFAARKVPSEDGSIAVDYAAWLSMREQNINNEALITAQLKSVNFNTAGIIETVEDSAGTVEVTPLITTSERSMKVGLGRVRGKPDAKKLLTDFKSDNVSYTIAASLTGVADTAYPGKKDQSGHIGTSEQPINVIVIADTDVLRDETWSRTQDFEGYRIVMPDADNSGFVINALDFMAGSAELISLRGRGTATRPFTVVEEIKRKAEERYLNKETELKNRLADTEKKLAQLQQDSQEVSNREALIYRAQQQREISRFTEQMVRTKKELRKVQHELRKDIDSLGSWLKFLNIGLVPIIVIIFALVLHVMRGKRRAI